ncbi:MAG: hypothetical protein Q9170_007170 [Blastenia crenularia]
MKAATKEAKRFIDPVLNGAIEQGQSRSIVEVLSSDDHNISQGQDEVSGSARRGEVIGKALKFIENIHASFKTRVSGSNESESFASPKDTKIVGALLDLVVLEGIYPCLTPGVGVPVEHRLKSALKGGFSTRPLNDVSGGKPEDHRLLIDIVDSICPVVLSRKGLAPNIQQRMSVDMIAVAGELAFSPLSDPQIRQRFVSTFKQLVDSMSAMDLFPQLTSLLHPSCPDWFRSAVSSSLSMLPLRPDGVKQTINFIASSTSADASTSDGRPNQSMGPSISLDCLARAAKLLTSVPSEMTVDAYIAGLAPQLFCLLDDPATDNKRIASYIIGTGLLSKRRLGSPGTTGWKLFAQPIHLSLDPKIKNCPIREDALKTAVDRLSALVQFHANPGLTKRLVGPILLPLWGLQCYALDHRRGNWADQVDQILSTYMKISATVSKLQVLSDHIPWDGTSLWTYMPGSSGGIEIRPREEGRRVRPDMATIIESVDRRIEQYLKLLRAAVVTDDQLSEIFTQACKGWLLESRSKSIIKSKSIREHSEISYDSFDNALESVIKSKLTQALLESYKDRIASSLAGIIKLVEPMLSAFVIKHQNLTEHQGKANPSFAGLGEIVKASDETANDDDGSQETFSTALNLLSDVVTFSDESFNGVDISVLESIQGTLKHIAETHFPFDSSLNVTASELLMILQLHLGTPDSLKDNKAMKSTNALAYERDEYRKALKFLSDEMAPVRAQGLLSLTKLISDGSPFLSVPSTATLIISLLQDEEEYIYLSAVRTLGTLASKHPKTVVKMLVEKYTDLHEESTLNVRLNVGEALDYTIEELGQLFAEEIAVMVGESMIAVASRRGDRPKTLQKNERAKRKVKKARKDVEDAWEVRIPAEEDDANDEAKVNAHIAKIVEGWADTGREEDVRIRTSALSILSTAIETNIAGLGTSLTSTAIDCVIAILKLEKDEGRAILRRAAVMVIMSVVKAIDAAEERGQRLAFGFAGENLAEVITVLRYVEATDLDEVVVGYIRALIESLQAWQQKSILGIVASRDEEKKDFSIGLPRLEDRVRSVKITELD